MEEKKTMPRGHFSACLPQRKSSLHVVDPIQSKAKATAKGWQCFLASAAGDWWKQGTTVGDLGDAHRVQR